MPRSIARARRSFHRFVHLSFAVGSVAVLAGACAQTTPSGPPGGGGADASLATLSSEPSVIAARASDLVAPHPWLAALVAPTKVGWTVEGEAFVSPGWRSFAPDDLYGVGARWPLSSNAPFEIGLGQDATRRVSFAPIGANEARASSHEGRIVFHDAYPSTDIVVAASHDRIEELLVLRDAAAPTTFAWKVTLPSRIPTMRVGTGGSIDFVSSRDRVELRIPRPFAVDANGLRRDADIALADGVMRIALDTSGLVFPVALDPTTETAVWTQQAAPPGALTARANMGMAYDAAATNIVMFGGYTSVGAVLGETWVWNGSAWSQTCTGGCTHPSARATLSMAFDSNGGRNVSVLFGGFDGASNLCDTWEWGAGAWVSKISAACPANISSATPAARSQSAMSYAGANGVIIFSGATAVAQPTADMWSYSGTAWTRLCNAGACLASIPSARNLHAMAWDANRSRLVLYGGITDNAPINVLGDTWEWDGTVWAQKCTAAPCNMATPGLRQEHVMSYDANRKKIVLMGGDSANVGRIDTWEWDGAVWTQIAVGTQTTPGGRASAGMAYDATRKRTTLFGGGVWNGGTQFPKDSQTWTYFTYGDQPCATANDCDTSFCVDGTCCQASCGACAICNQGGSTGTCTNVTNTTTARCTGATYCDNTSACVTKVIAGGNCTLDVQCGAGLVCSSEGVCCNSICNADGCHSCKSANTGGAAGSCLPITAGLPALSGCALSAASTCGLDSKCDGAGACRKWVNGTTCVNQSCSGTTQTNASTCNGSGACVAGSTQTCAAGYMCVGTACPTVCSGTDDSPCASGFYCNGSMCVAKNADGTMACTRDAFCTNGHCNHDQVCCNETCNGACESCTTARKGSGANGVCGPTSLDTDPYALCTAGSTTCGAPGKCNGTTRGTTASCLANAHSGVVCGATTCTNDAQSGLQCDGSGVCLAANNVACAPYKCANATSCATTCAMDSDCQQTGTGFFCSATNHCTAKNPNGTSCGGSKECATGNCIDGVCCDSACGSQCAACNVAGKMGTCSPATGAPVGTRTPCTAMGTTCGGSCNGTNAAACTYGDATKTCGSTCTGNMATLSACDSQGGCKVGATQPCASNLVCDPMANGCKTSCASDSDCTPAGKYACDSVTHQCVPVAGPTCSSDGLNLIPPTGGVGTPCAPYKCSGNACVIHCNSVSDCTAPNVCDSTGACIAPAAANGATGDSGGCSVASGATAGVRSDVAWLAVVGVGLAFGRIRRRRRAA